MSFSDVTALLMLAVDGALVLATPFNLMVGGGTFLVLLVLRVFAPGGLGRLLRLGIYAAAVYILAERPEMTEVLGEEPGFALRYGVAAIMVVMLLFLPLFVLMVLKGLLFGVEVEESVDVAALDGEKPKKRGIYAEDFGKEERREIATVMMTDIAGYSKRMEKNEQDTYDVLQKHNSIMRKYIGIHKGQEIKTIGDAFMVRFPNPLSAVKCAIDIQKEFKKYNQNVPIHEQLNIRIGIHMGETIVTKNDLFGECVNIAARLESVTTPGGISVSDPVYAEAKNKVDAGFTSVGRPPMKNIKNPPEVFRVNILDAADSSQVISAD